MSKPSGSARDLAGQLAAERQSFDACAAMNDFAEAVAPFLGKRKPSYTGN